MDVEKARRSTKLLQIGFSEGLLEDHVDKILAYIVILVLESSCQVNLAPSIFIDLNLGLFTSIGRLKDKGLVQFCQRVYRLPICHKSNQKDYEDLSFIPRRIYQHE